MKKLFPFIFLSLVVLCCVDKITLKDPDQPDSGILVQGRLIYGQPSTVFVAISELYFYEKNLPRAIEVKSLLLIDDNGHSIKIHSNGDGTYEQLLPPDDPNFPVETGRSYHLKIKFLDGREFVSEPEMLLKTPKIDLVETTLIQKDGYDNIGQLIKVPFIRFGVHTKLNTNNNNDTHIRWEFDQAYKLTDSPKSGLPKTCYCILRLLDSDISILNTAQSQAELTNHPLTETRIDYRFSEGFYLLLYQQIISENAFGYFEELNQLLAKKGTLFDPPAGAIRSNISSPTSPDLPVYGFFYVAQQDTARLYVSPAYAGYPHFRCPIPPSNSGEPRPKNSCDDCHCETKNTSTIQPIWWKF